MRCPARRGEPVEHKDHHQQNGEQHQKAQPCPRPDDAHARHKRVEPEQKMLARQHEQDAQVQHQQKRHREDDAHDGVAHDAEALVAMDLADDGGHGAKRRRRACDHDKERRDEHDLTRVAGHIVQKLRHERLRLAREHERLHDAQHGGRVAQDERKQVVHTDDDRKQRHDHVIGDLSRRARHAAGEKRVRHGRKDAGNAPVFQSTASSHRMQKPPSQGAKAVLDR